MRPAEPGLERRPACPASMRWYSAGWAWTRSCTCPNSRSRYAEVGLDFDSLLAVNGTPRSVNLVDRQGRRFSFFDGRHPADAELPSEFYLPVLEQSRHVHVAGRAAHPALSGRGAEEPRGRQQRRRRRLQHGLHEPLVRRPAGREECVLAGAVSGAFACTVHGTCEEQIGEDELADGMKRASATPRWQAVGW